MEFPALYIAADSLSKGSQRRYFVSLASEYGILTICAAMALSQSQTRPYYYTYAALFCIGLAVFAQRFTQKPEQLWYKGRALAESVKTLAWKYAMRAAPFADDDEIATATLRDQLRGVISANQFAGEKLPPDAADKLQVTPSMNEARSMLFDERLLHYLTNRIHEQRAWYARKAALNKRHGRNWGIVCILVYCAAVIASLVRAENPTWVHVQTEPLIAVAAAIVGWMQAKRFNELASSYILTAHEIGLVQAGAAHVVDEQSLSNFVDDAELAFSREHTQWLARQND